MNREEVIISIPHSGSAVPDEIRQRIPHSDDVLLREIDLHTDKIYAIDGPIVLQQKWNRIIADCNRAPDEIYTEGNLRAIGVVMLSFADGIDVFKQDPTIEEMSNWVESYHRPFHDELQTALDKAKFLIDCHSLASVADKGHLDDAGSVRADITLGNLYYCSCSAETTEFFRKFFKNKGYDVAVNDPYPGRYIISTYCSRVATPGIQIEINKKLYLNEETLEPYDNEITKLHAMFNELVTEFCNWYDVTDPTEKPMTDLSE